MISPERAGDDDAQARENGADPKASETVEQNAESPHPELSIPDYR